MIRGVNKQIIEISDTGNHSFERAILFVRPDSQRLDGETLRVKAHAYLAQFRLRPWFYSKGSFLRGFFRVLLGAALGSAATILIMTYFL